MDETATAPVADSAPASVISTPAPDPTPSEIGRMLAELRHAKAQESADDATEPEPIPAQAENAAPPEEAHGEAPTEAEPAAEPPIERPRSWTKDEDAEWQSLPRTMQQKIVAREQERDTGLRRTQNEAAEQRKAAQAERETAEKARQQYEAALPALMQSLQDAQAGAFNDVRTVDDVARLAQEDPFRYIQWQAHQTKVQAVQHEIRSAQERQSKEQSSKWTEEVREFDRQFVESLSTADKAKYEDFKKEAPEYLEAKGFKAQELSEYANGKPLSIYHPAVQSFILDGLKYQAAQKANTAAKANLAAKPVPPVQKPGVAKPAGQAGTENLQNLSAKLERTGKPQDLAAIIGALRAGA
jgi:hypothetical protein